MGSGNWMATSRRSLRSIYSRMVACRHAAARWSTGGGPFIANSFPSTVIREGPKRETPELISCWSMHMVSDRFRHCVEMLEPGVHQFFRVDILWQDESFAAKRYFMVVCNRLDAIDRGLTTMRFKGVLWEPVTGGQMKSSSTLTDVRVIICGKTST